MDEPDINYDDMIEDYMEDLEEQQQQPPFPTTTAAHPTGQYEYDDAFLEEMQATATQAESARMMMTMTTTTATTTMDAKNNNKNDNAVTMTSNKMDEDNKNNNNAPAVHDIVVSTPEGNVDSSPLLVDASSFTNEPATVLPSTHVRRELAARRSTTSNLFSFER